MPPLPVISGLKCIKALERAGFRVVRRNSSHVTLRKENPFFQTVVPVHKTVDRGTLRSVIRMSGLSVEQFIDLLD